VRPERNAPVDPRLAEFVEALARALVADYERSATRPVGSLCPHTRTHRKGRKMKSQPLVDAERISDTQARGPAPSGAPVSTCTTSETGRAL